MPREKGFENLKRPVQPMPEHIQQVLQDRNLWDAYQARPAYQRNDYLSWISPAVRPETKQKRLDQMLAELQAGDTYMKMRWNPRK